jgi:phosphatidylinositol glycan class P protein
MAMGKRGRTHAQLDRERSAGREVHGFVLWVSSAVAWVVCIAWAYTPDELIVNGLGLTYFPAKYWAVALPCFGFITVACVFLGYASLNLLVAAKPDSAEALGLECADAYARVLPRSAVYGDDGKNCVPDIGDIDIVDVNRMLFAAPATMPTDARSYAPIRPS